jgi:hypothetical protein
VQMPRRALIGVLVAAVLAPAAQAADPGRWRGVSADRIPLPYYQGMASDPDQHFFFDGVFVGLHRTTATLAQRASIDNVIPPAVTAREGYNHIGDITWDARGGHRVLLPLECYYPGTQPDANTCHTGSIGVADAGSLRWRYYVKLSPAEIPKAMWAERSPDGRLLWTSSGQDLIAYRLAEVDRAHAAPGGAPLRAVRRLRGAVPPSGITGAAFYGDRLLLAGQRDTTFEVWSVNTETGARRLEIQRGMIGESEGLDVTDVISGRLHWIITPFDALGRPPTYGTGANALLTFAPRGPRSALHLADGASRIGGSVRLRFKATVGGRPVAGAVVRVRREWALTSASGVANLSIPARGPGHIQATASRADLRTGRATVTVSG